MRNCLFSVVLAVSVCAPAWAQVRLPSTDVPGAQDSRLLGRYEGSIVVDYRSHAYDDFTLPLSKLEPVPTERDDRNNSRFAPKQKLDLEGKLTRFAYVLPVGRSPLEVLRNYQDVIKAGGGSIAFECRNETCGGDIDEGNSHGGGKMSLVDVIFPAGAVTSGSGTSVKASAGSCAAGAQHTDQRFLAGKLPSSAGDAHVAVMTYTLKVSLGRESCAALGERTIALVVLVEAKAREAKMVTITASEMSKSIAENGKVMLYGILFDLDKAVVKPESRPQLDEIASLLKANSTLKLLVAGHTDNAGGVAYNLDLSKRRADAVVAALTQQYGIAASRFIAQGLGSAVPVASNDTDAGREKNRRVELVKQ